MEAREKMGKLQNNQYFYLLKLHISPSFIVNFSRKAIFYAKNSEFYLRKKPPFAVYLIDIQGYL